MKLVPVVVGAAVVAAAIQLVPVDRSNPPVRAEVSAPDEVRAVLRRACYDCHSHETRWPWYAWVAPVSWLVAHDVEEGRHHLNFSAWDLYDEDERVDNADKVWEEVEEGHMPPWFYLPLHAEAKLGEAERAVLRGWAEAE